MTLERFAFATLRVSRWALPLAIATLMNVSCSSNSEGVSAAGGNGTGAEGGAGSGASSDGGMLGDADGGESIDAGGATPAEAPEPTPTEQGQAKGEAVTRVIGPEGGSVVSADGRLELSIPEGAIEADTEIGIQAVTNTAHGGVGDGYELLPDGQEFVKPVELVWHYEAEDVEGSAPSLVSLAFQDQDGLWQLLESRADPDAQTVTAETTHFTDFSPMTKLRVVPPRAEVKVEEFVGFTIESCTNLGQRQDGEIVYAYRCSRANSFVIPHLGSWAVNGVPGGNSTFGFADGTFVEKMSFEAPQEVPTPDEVRVHIDFTELDGNPSELGALVKILPARGDYSGTLTFSNTSGGTGQRTTGATAQIDWTADMVNAQFESYKASGRIDATVSFENCDPQELSFPILTGTLLYYPATSAVYKNHHVFAVAATGDATFLCGTPRKPEAKTIGLTFPISSCFKEPILAASVDDLSGTVDDCGDLSEEHGAWSFERREK